MNGYMVRWLYGLLVTKKPFDHSTIQPLFFTVLHSLYHQKRNPGKLCLG